MLHTHLLGRGVSEMISEDSTSSSWFLIQMVLPGVWLRARQKFRQIITNQKKNTLTSILNNIFLKKQYHNGMSDLHLMALTLRLIFTNFKRKSCLLIDSWGQQCMN